MKKGKDKKFGNIVISLIVSIALFVTLIMIESNITSPNGTATVVRAISDIQKGTVIDNSNKSNYFVVDEVDGKYNFDTAIRNLDELSNMIIDREVRKGEIISSERLMSKDSLLSKIENPVETSIRASDISQIVGGIIRKGDIIDISIINSTTNEVESVLKNVYVEKAISSEGREIGRNEDISTTVLNIIVSEEDEKKLNEKLNLGTIRISKIK